MNPTPHTPSHQALSNTDTRRLYVMCACRGMFPHPDWPAHQTLSEVTCPHCGRGCVFERDDLMATTVRPPDH